MTVKRLQSAVVDLNETAFVVAMQSDGNVYIKTDLPTAVIALKLIEIAEKLVKEG